MASKTWSKFGDVLISFAFGRSSIILVSNLPAGPKDSLILSFEQVGEPKAYLGSGFLIFSVTKPASCQSCFSLFDNISPMIYLVSGVPQRRFLQFPARLPYHLGKYMLLLILLGHILTAKPTSHRFDEPKITADLMASLAWFRLTRYRVCRKRTAFV